MNNLPLKRYKPIDKNSKLYSILSCLVSGEAVSLNNTEKLVPDHSLHCTLMSIERMGIQLERSFQVIPEVNGTKGRQVRRYWLDDYNLLKAQSIMEMSR